MMLRVSKAKAKELKLWKEGVGLEQQLGQQFPALCARATKDRIELASHFLRTGKRLSKNNGPLNRSAISRFYYSMYHAARAVTFHQRHGDDHEKHSQLPMSIPDDFPQRAIWGNELKNARELRNAADYDPYPKSDASWFGDVQYLEQQATGLMKECVLYLRNKGCQGI